MEKFQHVMCATTDVTSYKQFNTIYSILLIGRDISRGTQNLILVPVGVKGQTKIYRRREKGLGMRLGVITKYRHSQDSMRLA